MTADPSKSISVTSNHRAFNLSKTNKWPSYQYETSPPHPSSNTTGVVSNTCSTTALLSEFSKTHWTPFEALPKSLNSLWARFLAAEKFSHLKTCPELTISQRRTKSTLELNVVGHTRNNPALPINPAIPEIPLPARPHLQPWKGMKQHSFICLCSWRFSLFLSSSLHGFFLFDHPGSTIPRLCFTAYITDTDTHFPDLRIQLLLLKHSLSRKLSITVTFSLH
jgi:hypothetical protein